MKDPAWISRRDALVRGGGALAALAFFDSPLFGWGREGEKTLPFLDQPPEPPFQGLNLLDWQNLDSWITPSDRFFAVSHYGTPEIDASAWELAIAGLVERPRHYTLEELKGLPRRDVVFALECSGNSGFPWFQGGIGNARWSGVPLASVLEKAAIRKDGARSSSSAPTRGRRPLPTSAGWATRWATSR